MQPMRNIRCDKFHERTRKNHSARANADANTRPRVCVMIQHILDNALGEDSLQERETAYRRRAR